MKFYELGKPLSVKNNEGVFNCPFCETRGKTRDTKGHLRVDLERGVYHCFRCEASFRNTGIFILLKGLGNWSIKPKRLKNTTSKKNDHDLISLPKPYHALSESSEEFFPMFKEYAKARRISHLHEKKFNVGFTSDLTSPFFGRIIFCWYKDDSILSFFQGRDIIGSGPKYLSLGEKPFFSSFNNPVDTAVVTEGIFDMIASSYVIPSGAILGSKVSPYQKEQIIELVKKKIILILDADCYQSVIPFVKEFPNRLVQPILLSKKKDLGDMEEEEIRRLLDKWI
ncbi:MAG: hypothetical protein K6T87_16125 [Roseiflexus sp.]|uniref:hypothetical protein n=1 Tax=Roseiflexus sp. TaxID=2562120 RepID=UPI0025E4F052|nr:hypothetical protein [Roseiflexus sp.]MCL6542084.1 hypothetical protein [Roseiflexus sp.]